MERFLLVMLFALNTATACQTPIPTETLAVIETQSPPVNPSPDSQAVPYVQISFAGSGSFEEGVGCVAYIIVYVSGGEVTGNMHVKNPWYDENNIPQGDVYPTTTFVVGENTYVVQLAGNAPSYYIHEVWFEYNGMQSNHLTGLTCGNLPTPMP